MRKTTDVRCRTMLALASWLVALSACGGGTVTDEPSPAAPAAASTPLVPSAPSASSALPSSPVASAPQPDAIPPSTPSQLTGISMGPAQIELTWQPSTDNVGVAKYQVFRNGSTTPIAEPSGTQYNDGNLSGGTAYGYSVKAVDAANNVSPAATVTVQTAQAARSFAFGTLITDSAHVQEEIDGGVRVAMVELRWDKYEPKAGEFDVAYGERFRAQVNNFLARGMRVTLAMGLHYPPTWARAQPNSGFVAQDGSTSSQLNLVFNQRLRDRAAAYFDRIHQDVGVQNFWAIRLTSGGNAEVLYPDTGRKYWAFDVNAQNGPDMPPSMPRNPSPGWRPGDASMGVDQVGEWADWYIRALADSVDWQMRKFTALGFKGYYQVLTPGSGMRPDGFVKAVQNRLPNSLVGVGAVWHKLYQFLPDKRNVVVYVSSMADGSGGDDSCQPSDRDVALASTKANSWSAARWQSRIADEYGLQKNGENPGYGLPASANTHYVDLSDKGMLAGAIRQMTSCGYQGMYWAHSYRLWDGTMPFRNYAEKIKAVNGGTNTAPPMP